MNEIQEATTHLFTFPHSAGRYCSFKRILITTLKAYIFKFGNISMNVRYIFRVCKLKRIVRCALAPKKDIIVFFSLLINDFLIV